MSNFNRALPRFLLAIIAIILAWVAFNANIINPGFFGGRGSSSSSWSSNDYDSSGVWDIGGGWDSSDSGSWDDGGGWDSGDSGSWDSGGGDSGSW